MRACPAGNGKGACACSSDQVSNIRLRPSPREDIGATKEAIMITQAVPSAHEIRALASRELFGKPLVTNVLRAAIAEAIVASALGDRWRWCSADYWAWDFERDDGMRLEVKQGASRQTWHQAGDAESRITFDIAYRRGRYDGATWHDGRRRWADIYVFAHHFISDATADHGDPTQWVFYVMPTAALPDQNSVSLSRLRALGPSWGFSEVAAAVDTHSSGQAQLACP